MAVQAASKLSGGSETNPTVTTAGTDRGDAYNIFGKKN